MASFKTWLLVLCTLFAIFLVASSEVSTQKNEKEKVSKGVEDSKYGGYPGGGGGYPGGGGGYPGGGGGYPGDGGGYPGRGGGGGYPGGRHGGGYCRYRCCRGYRSGGCYRCCSHANEAPDAEFQDEP